MSNKTYNFFSKYNNFTIDDSGNIGQSLPHGLFNENAIGTNNDTLTVMQFEANKNLFIGNIEPLDFYVIGENIIQIYGQPIPRYTVKS